MPGIIIDIGTGDGKFVAELAKDYPDRLIIGLDPSHAGLKEISNRANKKPQRGGLPNALFVLANVESLPPELAGLANQVFINFPWGSLLKGIVLAEKTTWENIKKICAPGATIDILFGYNTAYEAEESARLGLPALSPEYLETIWQPKLAALNVQMQKISEVSGNELKNYPSSWAKRLAFGKTARTYYHVVAHAP